MKTRVDILIAGGGIAGLAAAAAFSARGHSVLVADPSDPSVALDPDQKDLRSTAYLQDGRDLLAEAGVWNDLAPHATPLEVLRVIDTRGWPPEIRATRDFVATDLGDQPFGWNVLNWRARSALSEAIAGRPEVSLHFGAGYRSVVRRDGELIVTLTDGTTARCRLLVGADGRDSAVREEAGISTRISRYGQMALACAATHDMPHDKVSTELYNTGGAFTLVPLGDMQGQPASAVVWMDEGPKVRKRLDASPEDLSEEMTVRSAGVLGALKLSGGRNAWPVITQTASRLSAHRTALIAEAAHVLPPIGAQGLNTSLADIRALLRAMKLSPDDPGSDRAIDAYERARAKDVPLRAQAIDLFNRVCKSGLAPVQDIRLAGLKLVHDVTPIRRRVMQAGLGR